MSDALKMLQDVKLPLAELLGIRFTAAGKDMVEAQLAVRPEICTRPPPISSLITGAVMTSALPFSTSRMAMRFLTFSRVTCLKMRAPRPSRVTCTTEPPFCWSTPGPASVM